MINENTLAYQGKSKYKITECKVDGTIPTSFDQTGSVWYHGGSGKKTIYYSIAYNDQVADGNFNIPFLGYSTSSVTIDGVTFTIRSGSHKVSIKASIPVTCSGHANTFAFYTDA